MSISQILADISPNPTLLVKYDANRGSWLDKPENLWAPCDWHSFYGGQNSTKTQLTTQLLSVGSQIWTDIQ